MSEERKKEEIKCPRCGSKRMVYLGRAIIKGREVYICRCENCGMKCGFSVHIYEEPKTS